MYEGTAMISGKRGQFVLTDGSDEEHLSKGVYDTYTKTNLRYSQVRSPMHVVCMNNAHVQRREQNNLPAQIDLYATSGAQYNFEFIAKGMLLHRYFCMCLLYNMYVLYVRFYVCLCMCECM